MPNRFLAEDSRNPEQPGAIYNPYPSIIKYGFAGSSKVINAHKGRGAVLDAGLYLHVPALKSRCSTRPSYLF